LDFAISTFINARLQTIHDGESTLEAAAAAAASIESVAAASTDAAAAEEVSSEAASTDAADDAASSSSSVGIEVKKSLLSPQIFLKTSSASLTYN
jgi:hypothetical protein